MKTIVSCFLILTFSAGCSSLRFKSTEEVRALGEEAFTKGDHENTEVYQTELLRRDEDDTRARLLRARSRDLAGNQLAGREDYNVVTTKTPEDIRGRLFRAELAIRQGEFDTAQEDLTKLTERQDLELYDRVAAFKFLGVIQLRRNNPSFAAMAFRQSTSAGAGASDPLTLKHVAEAHYNLGQCLFQLENFKESHENFVTYARLAPQIGEAVTPEDNYLLGVTAYLSGDFGAARTYLAKADPQLRAKAAQILDDPGMNSKAFH